MDNILKLPIKRSDAYEKLVEQYCATKNSSSDEKKVFNTIKDFMVFAALIGFQLNKSQPLDNNVSTTSIILETYASTDHDSYIYLMALANSKSLDILKDENLKGAIKIFEEYCNAGLEHINKWVFDNTGQQLHEDILFNQTLEYLLEREEVTQAV